MHAANVHPTHLLPLMQGFHDAYLAAALIAFSGFIDSLLLRRGLPQLRPPTLPTSPRACIRAG
jgi:hypothetical protein